MKTLLKYVVAALTVSCISNSIPNNDTDLLNKPNLETKTIKKAPIKQIITKIGYSYVQTYYFSKAVQSIDHMIIRWKDYAHSWNEFKTMYPCC